MNGLVLMRRYHLSLGFIIISIIILIFGCVSSPKSNPTFNITIEPKPELATEEKRTATQENPLTINPTEIIRPTSSSTLQPLNTVTPTLQPASPTSAQTLTPSVDIVWEILEQVSIERVLIDLKRLTGEMPICIDAECYTIAHRFTGSEGLNWAKKYIYQELAGLGYSVEIRDWSHSGFADQNIIAKKLGTKHPEEEIYFVAHVDGVNSSPAADDNASGVVDLLEMARILSKVSLSRTVVLFFSTGEEKGALGARSYVDQLSPGELSAIKYVISIDMVGYDADHDGVMQLWSGDHAPSLVFAQAISETIQTYPIDLVPHIITGCN